MVTLNISAGTIFILAYILGLISGVIGLSVAAYIYNQKHK
jgi:hypothetical protein